MKQSQRDTQESYLALVRQRDQIQIHCPVCLLEMLVAALHQASSTNHVKEMRWGPVVADLAEAARLLEGASEDMIDRAMQNLLGEIDYRNGQHYAEIPF